MATFREYKDSVSILQVAESLGYKPAKGFTKSRPVLQDAAGDKILIKNPTTPSTQLYWNVGNGEHGSVIDFVKNNLNRFPNSGRNEIDGLNIVLSGFAGVAYDNTKYLERTVQPQKIFNEHDYKVYNPTVADLSYLTDERKLDGKTVADFLPFIRIIQGLNDGYKNIAFPFTIPDRDNIVRGYELRNSGGFKSFTAGGDKVNAAWIADFSVNKADVDKVYFFESAIDAMSFYELHKGKLDVQNSVFVSAGGYPCAEQFLHVFKAYPYNVKIFGCHDNDMSGHIFDITLACVKAGQSCQKNKREDAVEFVTNGKKFTLPSEKISLKNFLKNAQFQNQVNVLKPKNGKDWNEVLKNKEVISNKKPVFKMKQT
ncbi:MAG: DUF3991 and toprim domain-containing protein [Prevotellaceae bacterium]|jgi:hypothetical protein|nr:DUF3991 and toprim domain-containing protein [Prevotellaceae bacterium]